ncbi:gamma-glutamyltransferase family protein [Gudongella sp. DL1XJH-153]|uniref:gamma-glutamyltransferase family protein n=1 Tax=Gudongella sp. DL1XJH-153 TaxID=3409804 RepID=UPI003BB7D997
MKFDPLEYNSNSQRSLVYSGRGMVATTNPYSSQAGLDIMKSGGNAFDAAVAAAAALVVVEPTGCGLGSDAFAILYSDGEIYGLNGSGYSPKDLTIDYIENLGLQNVPKYGPLPVMVPGVVASWKAIIERFGNLTLEEVLQPSIILAEEGHCIQPVISMSWKKAYELQKKINTEDCFSHWFKSFGKDERAPLPGELSKNQDLANTLKIISETNGNDFYKGALAEKITSFIINAGGVMTLEDMVEFSPEWVKPLSKSYGGYDIWELPPNGQGVTVLLALDILENIKSDSTYNTDSIHNTIEAMKIGFEDGMSLVGDPRYCTDDWKQIIEGNYGQKCADRIGKVARLPECHNPGQGGTVYLAAADGNGNMISFIQSNYRGFGSGLVVPGTGISLNNRGYDFSMDRNSPNVLAGRKRPYNTIIPGFITRDGRPVGPFGLMGGYMQPQGHVQLVTNMIDHGMNPQSALDSPRWQWTGGKDVHVEKDFPKDIREGLEKKGHRIVIDEDRSFFGRGQIIIRDQKGPLCGATEKRADSSIAAW